MGHLLSQYTETTHYRRLEDVAPPNETGLGVHHG